jgi:Raf kinase inhibitor-like YbhB/YbcL family protein
VVDCDGGVRHPAMARRPLERNFRMIDLYPWLRTLCAPVLRATRGGAQSLRFHLTSPDLKDGDTVPNANVYKGGGCDGDNVSPALEWHNPPPGTRSFAVTLYDPDAPTGSGWWHWQIHDIPSTEKGLTRGAGNADGTRPAGAMQSRNDYGESGYGGPCPPPGDRPHRYIFTVYALKTGRLEVPSGASCAMVGFVINANKLGEATLTATYGR